MDLILDDAGTPALHRGAPIERVVSLVPSLTEAIAVTERPALVGATDWCTHPADLDVTRVRGTKNVDWRRVVDLRPDLVVANKEENREVDVRRLRDAGIPVWVTVIEDVDQALASMRRLFDDALGWGVPGWLRTASSAWAAPVPADRARVVVPIWRDPWMVVGARNYTSDLLARAGYGNVFAEHPDRYPHVDLAEVDGAGADLVLLPDEPYPFAESDGPEAFSHTPTRLVSGRLLTWYGPAMLEAAEVWLASTSIGDGPVLG